MWRQANECSSYGKCLIERQDRMNIKLKRPSEERMTVTRSGERETVYGGARFGDLVGDKILSNFQSGRTTDNGSDKLATAISVR